MNAVAGLAPGGEHAAARVDALDLDPVVFALMHPYPGVTVMGLDEADQAADAYRRWLKLCAWHPDEPLVPSLSIDDAWRAHLADTAKYARDCLAAFGGFAHCYPHGRDTRQAAWHSAYQRTREMYWRHYGTGMPGADPDGGRSHPGGECCAGGSGAILILGGPAGPGTGAGAVLDRERPRPSRRPPARPAQAAVADRPPRPAGAAAVLAAWADTR